jgi:hypothetical protein
MDATKNAFSHNFWCVCVGGEGGMRGGSSVSCSTLHTHTHTQKKSFNKFLMLLSGCPVHCLGSPSGEVKPRGRGRGATVFSVRSRELVF